MSKSNMMILFVVAIGCAAISGHYFANRALDMGDYPVAILDWQSFVDKASTGENGELLPEGVENGVRAAQQIAKELSDSGYIVIDAQSVMSAPGFYYVRAGAN